VAPDEILHSNVPGETLASAIEKMDARGYNVINFDEFHFLPVDYDYIPDHGGIQPLRHYYFFKFNETPCGMRAWRKDLNLSNVAGAGHIVSALAFASRLKR
jgi:hypothetical protein